MATLTRREGWAVGTLAAILVVTAAWWALALWPPGDAVPGWVARTRLACFGARPDGLPDAGGWLLLVGQPIGMLATLLVGWGDAVRDGLRAAAERRVGRVVLAAGGAWLMAGTAVAGARIVEAMRPAPLLATASGVVPETYPRLDREAPPLRLVDQRGGAFALPSLRGRLVYVTFAYAHCEAICPLLVRDVLVSRRALEARGVPTAAVIVTLDPWRDVPARLPAIAAGWRLEEGEYVLSGPVDEVTGALDAWGVVRSRDGNTGDVDHPAYVFLLDPGGRLAYAAGGGRDVLTALGTRLAAKAPTAFD